MGIKYGFLQMDFNLPTITLIEKSLEYVYMPILHLIFNVSMILLVEYVYTIIKIIFS